MKFKSVALCAPIALLTACGGGGGSPTPTATGAPAPAPAPAPTPTPTPTTFDELTGDQTFSTACALLPAQRFFTPTTNFPNDFTLNFEAATETWTFAGPSPAGILDNSFGPNDIITEEPGVFTFYSRDNGQGLGGNPFNDIFFLGTPQFNGGTAQFVRVAEFATAISGASIPDTHQCVFGIPTALDDPLPQQTLNFGPRLDALGSALLLNATITGFRLENSELVLTADPTTGEIEFTLTLLARETIPDPNGGLPTVSDTQTSFGTFTGTTAIDGSAQTFFGGVVGDNSVGVVGEFTGWFFGPQGTEIGIAMNGAVLLPNQDLLTFTVAFGGPQDAN